MNGVHGQQRTDTEHRHPDPTYRPSDFSSRTRLEINLDPREYMEPLA
jgi:hypothetical protein